jgi:hypothetical protein
MYDAIVIVVGSYERARAIADLLNLNAALDNEPVAFIIRCDRPTEYAIIRHVVKVTE